MVKMKRAPEESKKNRCLDAKGEGFSKRAHLVKKPPDAGHNAWWTSSESTTCSGKTSPSPWERAVLYQSWSGTVT